LRGLACLLVVCVAPSAAGAFGLNDLRAAQHRPALRVDHNLSAAAARHAADLARRNHLDHDGFFGDRVRAGARAENVSYGCADQACAIRQWNNSPPHRANMLRADVQTYGIASARSSSGRQYWVLELGGVPQKPRGRAAYVRSAARGASGAVRCVRTSDGCLRAGR
jgi:hypothetical protein